MMTRKHEQGARERALWIRSQIPPEGLFAGQQWRISPEPFQIPMALADELQQMGRILLQFYRAADLLYRQSTSGKQPGWIAALLDQGKPADLIAWQRHAGFRHELPRVIRPDILLTAEGIKITELDSVPGGIGLTAWLQTAYQPSDGSGLSGRLVGGASGMADGFAAIFGEAPHVSILVSEESAMYRPEMHWLAKRLGDRFAVFDCQPRAFPSGGAVYRFFELFDLANVPVASELFARAARGEIRLTPPPKPALEEKLWLALLWNRNLQEFWRRELGAAFFDRLRSWVPYTWVVDPTPLPPHAAIPELGLTDWRQLKTLSQRQRQLILKISGFSPRAWGARGVYLGSDLSQEHWAAVVDRALEDFRHNPWVLQRYHAPSKHPFVWYDFDANQLVQAEGRVRLCPYYFVLGEREQARTQLGGVLVTICPLDKKLIHGMDVAVEVPAAVGL
ncbi:MAG: hypothetical protein RMN51_08175 [Verrucomicrobiota bacterium]|nr:hypothetical protein [Limisphaera sp.]MDW8382065.1 hypothetical protein [Verrucomicrobiota bacterium]